MTEPEPECFASADAVLRWSCHVVRLPDGGMSVFVSLFECV
jgi:hypothetical protein